MPSLDISPPKRRMIPLKDIRQTYGVPYSTARQWIREGKLKAYRVAGGRQVFIRVEDIEAMFVRLGGDFD